MMMMAMAMAMVMVVLMVTSDQCQLPLAERQKKSRGIRPIVKLSKGCIDGTLHTHCIGTCTYATEIDKLLSFYCLSACVYAQRESAQR